MDTVSYLRQQNSDNDTRRYRIKKPPSLLSEVQKGNNHQCSGYESHACRTQIRFLCMPPHG